RALDDLRQEHLAGAEQVADDFNAVHERPLDDVQRPRQFLTRFLGVGFDEIDDAMDERERETLFHWLVAPREVRLALLAGALDAIGERDEALGGVRPAIED